MTNTNKLKGLIKEKGLTQDDVADSIGVSRAAFNYKINNKRRGFTVSEIMQLCTLLSIDNKDAYFFN